MKSIPSKEKLIRQIRYWLRSTPCGAVENPYMNGREFFRQELVKYVRSNYKYPEIQPVLSFASGYGYQNLEQDFQKGILDAKKEVCEKIRVYYI